jgi:hypothetical protein
MHTHLRAGAPLTGAPALSSYSLSYSIRQSITKIKAATRRGQAPISEFLSYIISNCAK